MLSPSVQAALTRLHAHHAVFPPVVSPPPVVMLLYSNASRSLLPAPLPLHGAAAARVAAASLHVLALITGFVRAEFVLHGLLLM